MVNFTISNGTATIGTTEFSIAQNANYSAGSPKTTVGYVQAFLDVSAVVAGDQFQIRILERVNGGTQRVILTITVPPSTELYVTPLMLLGDGWDITIKKLAGTDRSILFSVRQDTNDVNITGGATAAALATAQTDLDDIQARLPAALVGGRMSSDVGSWLGTAAAAPTVAGIPKVEDATTQTRLTATRAGYLDNLNVGGNVAASAEVVAIQNNTRVVRVVPDVIERPDAGTTTFRVELLLYDSTGNMEVPDSIPTLTLVNQAGTDLSARLDSTTMTLVSTGRYRSIYTAAVADALEQLVWTFSVVEGGATRLYGNTSVIVDTSAVDFTAADRTKLNTLAADYTTARAAGLDALPLLDAAVSTRAPASTALSSAVWTGGRAVLVDHLDADVSSRAAAATAVSSADLTPTRAAKLDQLDAAITSRASSAALAAAAVDITALIAALAAVQSDTDNIQTRLPVALDGGGNMMTAPQSLAPATLTAIADAIFAYTIEATPANASTFLQRLRVLWSILASKATGLAITPDDAGTEHFRDAADTKDRAIYTLATDGTRTPGAFDGT